MASRSALGSQLVDWVGPESLELVDAGTGWPSHFRAKTTSDWVNVAAFVGPIGQSHRGRANVERRFQNPGSNRAIAVAPGEVTLLMGLYERDGTHLLVGMEAGKRLGRNTRQSLFMPTHLLRRAGHWGWAEHFSEVGERLVAFTPKLLPIYVELCRSGVHVSTDNLEQLIIASGAGDPESGEDAVHRAIATVERLVRRATFSRDVTQAYGGHCAMCGLDFTLVEGAHIYPVAAPGSADRVWNGMALCRNHHAAFDSFILYVEPESRAIQLHPEFVKQSGSIAGCKAFAEATFPTLALPRKQAAYPRPDMFEKRYEFFRAKYAWV